jgi:hypothetical protein
LPCQWEGALAEAVVALEKDLPELGQSLDGVIAASLRVVAVGPFVIPGQENEGVLRGLE